MHLFDMEPHKCKANSDGHADRQNATCVLRDNIIYGSTMRVVSASIEIEETTQYNHLVNRIATIASMVQNCALVNKMCVYIIL